MEGTWYPLAGSREVIGIDVANHTTVYNEQIGWISWLSNQGDPYGTHTPGKGLPSGHQTVAICPFYGTGTREDAVFAITMTSPMRSRTVSSGVMSAAAATRMSVRRTSSTARITWMNTVTRRRIGAM